MNRYNELSPENQTRYDRAINAEASGAEVTIVIERNGPAPLSDIVNVLACIWV